MLILLDSAHGHNTPGKRSPDGTLLEYAYTRDLANQILTTLQTKGHNAQLLVPETEDIPLKERVRRANAICAVESPTNALCPPHPLSPRPHRKLLMGNKQNLANLLSQEESDEKAGVVLQVISPLVRV